MSNIPKMGQLPTPDVEELFWVVAGDEYFKILIETTRDWINPSVP